MILDFFILFLASAVGGIVGGSIAFVLGKNYEKSTERKQVRPSLRAIVFPERKAKIIQFPSKSIKFSKN